MSSPRRYPLDIASGIDQNKINPCQALATTTGVSELQVGTRTESPQRVTMSHEPESPSLVIGSEEWVESFPEGLYDLAMELTLQSVEHVERLDPINRTLIWDDGKALSFDESLQRISADLPQLPVALIRVHLIDWMDMDDLPGDLTEEEIEEMDISVSAWAAELRRLDRLDQS